MGVKGHSSVLSVGSRVPARDSAVFRLWVWFLEGTRGRDSSLMSTLSISDLLKYAGSLHQGTGKVTLQSGKSQWAAFAVLSDESSLSGPRLSNRYGDAALASRTQPVGHPEVRDVWCRHLLDLGRTEEMRMS